MSLHDVPAKTRIGPHRPFQIHDHPSCQTAQTRPVEGFPRHFRSKRILMHRADGQTYAVYSYDRPKEQVIKDRCAVDIDRAELAGIFQISNLTEFFYDPCEHMQSRQDRVPNG